MDKAKYYKYLFILAALYNIVNSLTFIIVSIAATNLFPTFGVSIPPSMIWLQLSLILIIILGIGYIIVSRDIKKNHGIVLIGALAKISFLILTIIYLGLGEVGVLVVLLGGIDLIFVCLFVEFLIKSKNI